MIPDVHEVRIREGVIARVPVCHRGCMVVREREFVIGWLIEGVRGWLPDRVPGCAVAWLVECLCDCKRVCWPVCVNGCVRAGMVARLIDGVYGRWVDGLAFGWLWASLLACAIA